VVKQEKQESDGEDDRVGKIDGVGKMIVSGKRW
jgi:hypothetical protein